MSWGIIMKGINAIHFKSKVDFFFEFIPQLTFMLVTFAYMDFMIFTKWGTDWRDEAALAPGIINLMIDMPLKMGTVCVAGTKDKSLFGTCSS